MIFFTLPPWRIPYPYILVNNKRPELGLRYLTTYNHHRIVKAIIIDSGIEIFRDPHVKDYPGGFKLHILRQVRLYEKIKSLCPHAEVHVVIPDYCDDYNPKALWIDDKKTNIERTLESILYATEHYKNVPWLVPVQGHYRSCLLYTSPSPRDLSTSRMPSSA